MDNPKNMIFDHVQRTQKKDSFPSFDEFAELEENVDLPLDLCFASYYI